MSQLNPKVGFVSLGCPKASLFIFGLVPCCKSLLSFGVLTSRGGFTIRAAMFVPRLLRQSLIDQEAIP